MKTLHHSYDIEEHTGHHAVRRNRAETRGSARRQTKQALSHLSHAALLGATFGEDDDTDFLQFAGALPAGIAVE